jgi:hypothetical protein
MNIDTGFNAVTMNQNDKIILQFTAPEGFAYFSTNYFQLQVQIQEETNTTSSVDTIIFKNENIGIGTTDANYKLNVGGDINFTGDLYKDGVIFTSGTDLSTSGATVGGNLIPSADITYDLGSTSKKWRDLYLSGTTIHLGDETISLNTAGNFELSSSKMIIGGETLTVTNGSLQVGEIKTNVTFGNAVNLLTESAYSMWEYYNIGSFNIQSYYGSTFDGWIIQNHKLYFTGSDFGGMTSNTSYINDELYVASSSSTWYDWEPYKAFNLIKDDFWHSNEGYDSNTGVYYGSVSTVANGITYNGEWLQIQYPNPFLLTNFTISPRQENLTNRTPNSFVIVGSNNGSTWNLLHEETNYISWGSTPSNFVVTGVTESYSYYRLITRKVGFADSDRVSIQINEWELNPSFTSKTYKIRININIPEWSIMSYMTGSKDFVVRLLDENDTFVQTLYTDTISVTEGEWVVYSLETEFVNLTAEPGYKIQILLDPTNLYGGFSNNFITIIQVKKQIDLVEYPRTNVVGNLIAPYNSHTIGNLFITGGNVGIGLTAPSYKLHVGGDIYATGKVVAFSDERLKTEIAPIENSLNKVSNLRGVEYKMLNSDEKQIGVIAQEVEKVCPEFVVSNDEYKGVCYGNMVGLLIEAIKELNEKINKLENEKN